MKLKNAIIVVVLFVGALAAKAQVNINVNLGNPPSWGIQGENRSNFYFLPEIDAYYDIRASQFMFLNNGRWIRSRNLPTRYRNYDLRNGHKVFVENYNGSRPYDNYNNDRIRYRRKSNVVIRNENNYIQNNHDHGKGHGYGKEHGHGHGKGKH